MVKEERKEEKGEKEGRVRRKGEGRIREGGGRKGRKSKRMKKILQKRKKWRFKLKS